MIEVSKCFGPTKSINLINDGSRKIAFVEFCNKNDAVLAKEKINKSAKLVNSDIIVDFEEKDAKSNLKKNLSENLNKGISQDRNENVKSIHPKHLELIPFSNLDIFCISINLEASFNII